MFGSSPFGHSSSSPFGSQLACGQANNAGTNPFAPKPFGSTTLFGSQTGGSIFGGTSTGVFGGAQSSPLGSTAVFGATSSSAFGASTMPAFGSSSSSFGSSSVFGQKPAFGGFGSTNTQTSPFGGGSFQQSQPTFGSSLFGSSTPFGAPSQSAFGTPSTPAFGATSTPAFGSTTTPTFGSTGGAFGLSGSPVFGSSTPAFGVSSSSAFGAPSTSAFGATSTPAFGATSTPAFGASSAPAFGSSSNPFSFGQSTSAFGSSPFGTTTSPFGAQSASFGAQATTSAFGSSAFGQSGFGGQHGGSRALPYTPTPEADISGTQGGRLESISAMPAHKDKSHEELRWEDYQLGDKGGPTPAGQSPSSITFGNTGFGSLSTSAFSQPSSIPFSATTSSNPFAPKTPGFGGTGFGSTSAPAFNSSPFMTSNTSSPFGSTPSLFSASATTFGSTPSLFSSSSSSGFGTSPSMFGSLSVQGTGSTFGTGLSFGNTQSSPLFQSITPSLGQPSTGFGQANSSFGQNVSPFGQTNLFNSPSSGFGGSMFSSMPSLQTTGFGQATPSLSTPFQSTQPAQTTGAYGFGNFGQNQSTGAGGFGSTIFGQNPHGLQHATQSSALAQQPMPITNPFGTLPAMPQMSIGRSSTSDSIQYGISGLPVMEKPAPVRISSMLTSRHLAQRRIRLPARKYHPKSDGPKVPFFSDEEETPSTPKADALFIPRENPRALVVRPLHQWPSKSSMEKTDSLNHTSPASENGKNSEAGLNTSINGSSMLNNDEGLIDNGVPSHERAQTGKKNQKLNGFHETTDSMQKGDSCITLTGHRAGEAAIVYEHGADIEALMPKLRHSDFYTEPRIQELAAKERAEPGFCRRVKDFVVGRHGYGSIKFIGETDIRRLDLESLIQFNNREVIVYHDESKKPPVGQGLNKPAVVTLLNIKSLEKSNGEHYTEGPRIERYKEWLRRKTEDQGAEFISYDPVKGEWKFRVNHFSGYKLKDEDEDELGKYRNEWLFLVRGG